MKKLYWVIVIVAIVTMTFWGGYSLGKSSKVKDILIANNIITDELIAASQNILLLEKLSEGKIDKAISLINSRLDTQIALVNNFLPKDNSLKGRIIADDIFLRVAKYRNEFPRKQTDNFDNDIDEFLVELLKTKNK